jgi:hypothetical protein
MQFFKGFEIMITRMIETGKGPSGLSYLPVPGATCSRAFLACSMASSWSL